MAKIKIIEWNGKYVQHQYWCLGCGYEHAFNTGVHQFNGDLNNPTISPSLLQNFVPGKTCHSFIKNGQIQYLGDCHHELRGKTIELPDIDKMLEERTNQADSHQ